MTRIDVLILIVASLGAVVGFYKGFIKSITSLLGLILGYYISLRFAWFIENLLVEATGKTFIFMHLLAFVLCFILVMIATYFMGSAVDKMFKIVSLGCVNRLAGAFLGIFKGMIIVGALIYIIEIADRHDVLIKPDKKEASLFYKPLATLIPSLVPQVKRGMEQLKGKENSEPAKTI